MLAFLVDDDAAAGVYRLSKEGRMRRKVVLTFGHQCRLSGLPVPEPEFFFAKPRRWRFDWAWPDCKLAVEQEGGIFIRGRHTRGAGYVNDMAKYNAAALAGWRVLRFTPQQMQNGMALDAVERILHAEPFTRHTTGE